MKSLKIAAAFIKYDRFNKSFPVDYLGIPLPDEFVIGYGLDWDEYGRGLKDVYKVILWIIKYGKIFIFLLTKNE